MKLIFSFLAMLTAAQATCNEGELRAFYEYPVGGSCIHKKEDGEFAIESGLMEALDALMAEKNTRHLSKTSSYIGTRGRKLVEEAKNEVSQNERQLDDYCVWLCGIEGVIVCRQLGLCRRRTAEMFVSKDKSTTTTTTVIEIEDEDNVPEEPIEEILLAASDPEWVDAGMLADFEFEKQILALQDQFQCDVTTLKPRIQRCVASA